MLTGFGACGKQEKRVKEDEVLKKNLEEVVGYSAGSSVYDKQRSRHCLGNYISYTEGIMAGSPRREIRPKIAPRKSRHINSANSWPMQS